MQRRYYNTRGSQARQPQLPSGRYNNLEREGFIRNSSGSVGRWAERPRRNFNPVGPFLLPRPLHQSNGPTGVQEFYTREKRHFPNRFSTKMRPHSDEPTLLYHGDSSHKNFLVPQTNYNAAATSCPEGPVLEENVRRPQMVVCENGEGQHQLHQTGDNWKSVHELCMAIRGCRQLLHAAKISEEVENQVAETLLTLKKHVN